MRSRWMEAFWGFFFDGPSRLIVATSKGVQYFDVSKPFKPEEESAKFEKSNDESAYSITEACLASEKRVILLEEKSDGNQRFKVVSGVSAVDTALWKDLYESKTISSVGLRCFGSRAYVFGTTQAFGTSNRIFVKALDVGSLALGSNRVFSAESNDLIKDFHLTEKGDQIWLLFNRSPMPSANEALSDDSRIRVVNASDLSVGALISVGSQGQALASFKLGNSFGGAIFVGVDRLLGNSDNLNQLLLTGLPFSGGSQIETDRGSGSAAVGTRRPSRWWSSASSDDKFGLVESAGISLIGRGPRVEVSEYNNQDLASEAPLKFRLKADRDSSYAIYFDQSYNLDGESSGLTREPGLLIRRGNLAKDELSEPIELSLSDLGVTTDRRHSLSITVADLNLNQSTAPLTRIGLPFLYDPPPEAVKNLKLRSGDSSIWLFFDSALAEDLSHYEIHFSYNAADLAGPTFSERTFSSGVAGISLSSPIQLPANKFDGSYPIHPVLNFQDVFVRVISVDKGGQKSSPSDLVQKKAYPTLTIPQALGSPSSCRLSAEREVSLSGLFFLICWGIVLWRLRLKKKLGPALLEIGGEGIEI